MNKYAFRKSFLDHCCHVLRESLRGQTSVNRPSCESQFLIFLHAGGLDSAGDPLSAFVPPSAKSRFDVGVQTPGCSGGEASQNHDATSCE